MAHPPSVLRALAVVLDLANGLGRDKSARTASFAWRLARAPDPLGRATGLAAAMALAAVLVLGVFSPALEDPLSSMPFWALGGLTWALGRASRTDISAIADDAAGSEPNAVGGGPDEGPDLAFGTGP